MNKSKKVEIREELVMPRCPFCGQAIIADQKGRGALCGHAL